MTDATHHLSHGSRGRGAEVLELRAWRLLAVGLDINPMLTATINSYGKAGHRRASQGLHGARGSGSNEAFVATLQLQMQLFREQNWGSLSLLVLAIGFYWIV